MISGLLLWISGRGTLILYRNQNTFSRKDRQGREGFISDQYIDRLTTLQLKHQASKFSLRALRTSREKSFCLLP